VVDKTCIGTIIVITMHSEGLGPLRPVPLIEDARYLPNQWKNHTEQTIPKVMSSMLCTYVTFRISEKYNEQTGRTIRA
jgi:hypothetical protein